MPARPSLELGGVTIAPGGRETIDIPVSVMSDHTPVALSVHAVHGKQAGPTLFVSAAVHGDEIIGVEIVRRLLRAPQLARLRGTLLAIPIVNTFGFLLHSRYLPDRRDLNRCFPGSARGSLAARLAQKFLTEVVSRSDFGIDLHSAAIHRENLPQIRISPGRSRLPEFARAFGAPVVLTSPLREGSLRGAAAEIGVDMLLYEAGEGLRFDETAVRAGVSGILRVMRELEMIPARGVAKPRVHPVHCSGSGWTRAPAGGLFRAFRSSGETVKAGDVMGVVSDPFGDIDTEVRAASSGIVIGRATFPVVNEGDALFHVATIPSADAADAAVDGMTRQMDEDPMFDEDEII